VTAKTTENELNEQKGRTIKRPLSIDNIVQVTDYIRQSGYYGNTITFFERQLLEGVPSEYVGAACS
jgi:hypothetical protein